MMKNKFKKINLDYEIFFVFILFLISTIYFFLQHYYSISWDFQSYALNAKYLFSNGTYFEALRPPIMPVILGLLSFIFGWTLSEYVFILLVSLGFAYCSYKLAKLLKLNPVLFYTLSLSPYVLKFGLINGTELISIVFLELGLIFLIKENYYSGLFLALSALSRYTGLVFFPILFLHKRFKNIFLSLFLFGLSFVPWFIYNYYKFGNFFMSIADQYANNILYRSYINQPFNIGHFLELGILYYVLAFFGILICFYMIIIYIREGNLRLFGIHDTILKYRIQLIMVGLFLYTIYSYINIPIKGSRYLFLLVLPLAYFSCIFIEYILNYLKLRFGLVKRKVIFIFVIIFFNFLYFIVNNPNIKYSSSDVYLDAIDNIESLGYGNCSLLSNGWVMLNYYGKSCDFFPSKDLVSKRIEEGHKILIFYDITEPDYSNNRSFLFSNNVLYESDEYVILGREDICLEEQIYDITYVEGVSGKIFEMYGYEINTNPCFLMFHNLEIAQKVCNFVNFNGFVVDENRVLP